MTELEELEHAIAALEAQRARLGDAVVNTAVLAMRERLLALRARAGMEQRRQVTVLFADLVDFTALSARLDAEDLREVVNAYFWRWTRTIERRGGTIEKFIGDAVMAIFGLTEASGIEPQMAVRAALDMQEELADLNTQLAAQGHPTLRMRTGIHTGSVVVSTMAERRSQEFVVMGESVNLASRLQSTAPVDAVAVSHETFLLIRNDFEVLPPAEVHLKGVEHPVLVYQVAGERARSFHPPVHLAGAEHVSLFGRDEELRRLHALLDDCIRSGQGQLVVVSGEAGMGKSRLLLEFEQSLAAIPETRRFHGRATPTLRGAPYSMLRDMFAEAFGIQDSDPPATVRARLEAGFGQKLPVDDIAAEAIGRLLGFNLEPGPMTPLVADPELLRRRGLGAMGRFFAALTSDGPVVVLLEDLHWADESTLELIDRLDVTLADRRLFVVASTRSELFERRPEWGAGKSFMKLLTLSSLPPDASRRLIRAQLHAMGDPPEELVQSVAATAEGNPFFIEELIQMLVADGVIDTSNPQWTVDPRRLARARLPQTLTGVLQARLDRLSKAERSVVERAAVVGRRFWDETVHAMAPTVGAGADRAALELLQQRAIIARSDFSAFERAGEYAFRHALLRDVSYNSVLRHTRRTFHRRAAAWLEDVCARTGRSDEFAALIADHHQRGGEPVPAARWYGRAAALAARQYSNGEAIQLLSAALATAPDREAALRFDLLLEREQLLDMLGRREEQAHDIDQLEIIAAAENAPSRQAAAALRRARYCFECGELDACRVAVQQTIDAARLAQDLALQGAAQLQLARVLAQQARYTESVEMGQQAQALAIQAGDLALQLDAEQHTALAYFYLGEIDSAHAAFERALALAVARADRRQECTLLNRLSWMPYSRADYERAAAYCQASLELARTIGDRMGEANALTNLGNIHIQQSQYEPGRMYTHQALEIFRELGDRAGEGALLDNLGNAAWGSGDFVAARRYKEEALTIVREAGDRQTEAVTLANLGIVCTDMGDVEAGRAYVLAALDLFGASGNRYMEGIARSHLAILDLWGETWEDALIQARRAYAIAEELDTPRDAANALALVGEALVGLGDYDAAAEAFAQVGKVAATLPSDQLALVAAIEQANIELAKGFPARALALVEPLLDRLPSASVDSVNTPARLFWICYRILNAAGDSRDNAVLEAGYQWMEGRMALFADPEQRLRFRTGIPYNRLLWDIRHAALPLEVDP